MRPAHFVTAKQAAEYEVFLSAILTSFVRCLFTCELENRWQTHEKKYGATTTDAPTPPQKNRYEETSLGGRQPLFYRPRTFYFTNLDLYSPSRKLYEIIANQIAMAIGLSCVRFN